MAPKGGERVWPIPNLAPWGGGERRCGPAPMHMLREGAWPSPNRGRGYNPAPTSHAGLGVWEFGGVGRVASPAAKFPDPGGAPWAGFQDSVDCSQPVGQKLITPVYKNELIYKVPHCFVFYLTSD